MSRTIGEIFRISVFRTPVNKTTPFWLPHVLLTFSMASFYTSRWLAGEVPPSTTGLIFPAESFYGISALCSLMVWPLMIEISARLLRALSPKPTQVELNAAKKAYAYPLFVWLGCIEFGIWLTTPTVLFRLAAPLCLLIAMTGVIFHFYRLLRQRQLTHWASLWRGIFSLCPQLIIAGLFIR